MGLEFGERARKGTTTADRLEARPRPSRCHIKRGGREMKRSGGNEACTPTVGTLVDASHPHDVGCAK
jgi:hypothetical protein